MDSISEIEQKVKELKTSPIFNLSLSSLELFHSNFIYWMLRQDEFADNFTMFSDFDPIIQKKGAELELKEITREEQNLDIVLKFKVRGSKSDVVVHTLVIENKFKSLPTSEQLDGYASKVLKSDEVSYILLSFSQPPFFNEHGEWFTKNDTTKVWRFMHYGDLASQLNAIILNGKSAKNNYHLSLINDYRQVIEILHEIFYEMKMVSKEKFLLDKSGMLIEALREIRFRDFYVKKRAENFCYEVYRLLRDDISDEDAFKGFGEGLKIKEKGKSEHKITVNSGMTRSQALCDFKYRVSNHLVFGVQLQGNQYRRTIEGPSSRAKDVREAADKLLSRSNFRWFDLSDRVNGDKDRLYPKGGKDFNSYGKTFFYRSFYMDGSETVGEIKEYVMQDMKYLYQHKEELVDFLT